MDALPFTKRGKEIIIGHPQFTEEQVMGLEISRLPRMTYEKIIQDLEIKRESEVEVEVHLGLGRILIDSAELRSAVGN